MATTRTKATTRTIMILAFALLIISSSSSSWQTQARKTNWNEINTVLKPRTQGLHNYDSTLFTRSQNIDAFNETQTPATNATNDKEDEKRKGKKGSDGKFFSEQGKKSKKSIKVTPPPKDAPTKGTPSPTLLSPSSAPSVLDDDIFFVVPPSKKKDKEPSPLKGSPAPTASMPPSSIPSVSPEPTISVQPTILRGSQKTKNKKNTFPPTAPDEGSKQANDSEKNRKSKKEIKNEAKTMTPVPPVSFKDGEPKFTMKKTKVSDGKGSKAGGSSGKGKGVTKEKDSSKAKLKKSKSSKAFGSENPSVAPSKFSTVPSPPVHGPPATSLPETSSPSGAFVRIELAPFMLRYVFEQTSIPSNSDTDEVETLTTAYLTSFVRARFSELTDLETVVTGERFVLLMPFEMNYTSTAVFSSLATDIPTAAELDLTVMSAFEGNNQDVYLDLLSKLPDTNIFSTTTEILFDLIVARSAETDARIFEEGVTKRGDSLPTKSNTKTNSSSSSESGSGPSKAAIGAAAGICAVIAMAIAGAHVRKRTAGTDEEGTSNGARRRRGMGDRAARFKSKSKNNRAGNKTGSSLLVDKLVNPITETSTTAGNTYQADSTIYGDDSTVSRRQTRFARSTRFAPDPENQSLTTRSLASRSEWALSTRAISEVGTESDASTSSQDEVSDQEGQNVGSFTRYPVQRQRLCDEEDAFHSQQDPLVLSARREDGGAGLNESFMQYNDASSQDHFADSGLMQDDLSVDSFVPLRVVDLIKRFSPPMAPANRQSSTRQQLPREDNVF